MKRSLYIFGFLLAGLLLAGSCSDDDTFTTSASALLTFERDTLTLDTVFSTVESSTYNFLVYNKNSSGLRLSQVRLEKGNQTGFRVNVDGSYLDNQTGSQVQGLELRGGDSLRVFVELTSAYNGADEPELVEDNLVFSLESGAEQEVCLRAWSWDAILLDSMIISGDSTISSQKPIVVRGGIRVDSAAVLYILAPTKMYFSSGAGIDVHGTLVAEGEAGEDVVFRSDRLDHMFDYLPYDRLSGMWRGIRLFPSSTQTTLTYADIHGSEYGIQCDSAAYDGEKAKFVLTNVSIHNCKGNGITAINSMFQLVNCQVSNTLGDCLAIYGGYANIVYCTLAQFYPFSSERGVALRFTNELGGTAMPLRALNCINSIITGYADDEVMGSQGSADSTAAYSYQFYNTIIRTPEITDSAQLEGMFYDVVFEEPGDSIEGAGHFMLVDADQQQYDFRLDSLSTARGLGIQTLGEVFTTTDRLGRERGERPDAGCYQFSEE